MDVVLTVVVSVLVALLSRDAEIYAPALARKIVKLSSILLPTKYRDRFHEEWLSDLGNVEGPTAKLIFAIDTVRAATVVRLERLITRNKPVPPNVSTETLSPDVELVTREAELLIADIQKRLQEDLGEILDEVANSTAEITNAKISEPPTIPEAVRLTEREVEILRLTAAGKTAWEIGATLNISERTVDFHIQNVMEKFGVHNKTHAAAKAMGMGLFAL